MLTPKQVKHVAALARLGLKDADIERFSRQLSDILTYIEKLNEADTEGIKPTSQVTGLKNVARQDEVKRFCERDKLLACSELPIVKEQIKVKPVITF